MHEKDRYACQTIICDANMLYGMYGLGNVPPTLNQGSIQGLFKNDQNTTSETYDACVKGRMSPRVNQCPEDVLRVCNKHNPEPLVPCRSLRYTPAPMRTKQRVHVAYGWQDWTTLNFSLQILPMEIVCETYSRASHTNTDAPPTYRGSNQPTASL